MTPRPLSEMSAGDSYKGQDGGLYGAGRNTPPDAYIRAARRTAARIVPLAPDGTPSPSGVIGLLAVGFSNAREEFRDFIQLSRDDRDTSPNIRGVNGAQAHMGSPAWATGESEHGDPWQALGERLEEAGVTAAQVQAAWVKMSPPAPAQLGEFPRHAERTLGELRAVLMRLGSRLPNLRLAYFSSRIYAGHALTPLSPEPYAYEDAFAVRWLIQEQAGREPDLTRDSPQGPRNTPLALWGPYLWANGAERRESDGLTWTRDDLTADGTHPSPAGSRKVARLLLRFFQTEPTAHPWFLR